MCWQKALVRKYLIFIFAGTYYFHIIIKLTSFFPNENDSESSDEEDTSDQHSESEEEQLMDLCQQFDEPSTQAEEESYDLEQHMEEASEAPQEETNDGSNLGTAAPDEQHVKMSEALNK